MADLLAAVIAYALAGYVVHLIRRDANERIAEVRNERDRLREELSKRTDDLVDMKQRGFDTRKNLEPPKPEKMPDAVALALSRYPAEVRGQTERWIRDQRRAGVDWPIIESRVGARNDESDP